MSNAKKKWDSSIMIIAIMVFIASMSRLIPHPPNFVPITAIAIFAGSLLQRKIWAFVIPLLALLVSDFFIGFHTTLPFVYGSFLLIVLLGLWLGKHFDRSNSGLSKAFAIGGSSLVGSLIFFVITNLGVWLTSGWYSLDISGLIHCFVMAIPFFHYTVAGDLSYSMLLFGVYFWAIQPRLELVLVKSSSKNKHR